MDVTVNMKAEEFLELMAWKKDRELYKKKVDEWYNELKTIAKKVTWAIEEDPKRTGKVKIVDQEHAAELLGMAYGYME